MMYCIGTPLITVVQFYHSEYHAYASRTFFIIITSLLTLQTVLHFVFFFRQKVRRKPSDPKTTFYPRLIEMNYWVAYAIIPLLLIVAIAIEISKENEHKAVQALLLFLLFTELGSLIWYQSLLYPRFRERKNDWHKKAN